MNKQLKLFGRAVVVVLGLCIAGCGGESAEDVAETCIDYLEDAEFSDMRLLATGGMITWIDRAERKYDEVERLLGEKKAKKLKNAYDDLKYEMGEVPDGGDKVTVPIKINGQDTPMTLIKLGGKWRVEKFDFPIL